LHMSRDGREGLRMAGWGRAASHAGTAPNVWRSRRPGPGGGPAWFGYNVASGDKVFGVVPTWNSSITVRLLNFGTPR
jgi:hypothetical protein